jgi:hypothetical protein
MKVLKLFTGEIVLSDFLTLPMAVGDEFLALYKLTRTAIAGNINSDFSLIDHGNLPSDIDLIRYPYFPGHPYSLILLVPGTYMYCLKVRKDRGISSVNQDFLQILSGCSGKIGLLPESNDIVINGKRVYGDVLFEIPEQGDYVCFGVFINTKDTVLTSYFGELFALVHIPEVKTHSALETLGEIELTASELIADTIDYYSQRFNLVQDEPPELLIPESFSYRVQQPHQDTLFVVTDDAGQVVDLVQGTRPERYKAIVIDPEVRAEFLASFGKKKIFVHATEMHIVTAYGIRG